MTTVDVKSTRSIDKSKYVQPSTPAVFGQDGWICKDEPAVLDDASTTASFLYGVLLAVALLGIAAYVVLGIVL